MTWRAGIVGCGRIGCAFDDDSARGYVSTHAGAYVRTPGVELVALADLDASRVHRYGERFGVAGRYQDYREMLARERLDILSVCTGSESHREIVEGAAAAGVKGIFCEKPIADSLAAAAAMIERCAEAGVVLMIDHQRRFDRFHQEVASFLRAGRLGHIQQVTCYYTAGVANTASHLFDLLRFFFGEAEWVRGIYSQGRSSDPQDPNVDAWLGFETGLRATVQACDARSYTIFEVAVLGTSGRLRLTSHGFDAEFEEARESARFAGYRELGPAPPPIDPRGPREFMLQAVAHLLECLEKGRKPLCSGEDGWWALRIVRAVRESAEADGRRVKLTVKRGSPRRPVEVRA
jgi:predicted dehydrogenase